MSRLDVRKTYKLYIGGEFPRSESGRSYEAEGANVARASRKDVRDAVRAARSAQAGWAGRTAYNRGQILYRMAEMMEARRGAAGRALRGRGRGRRARSTAWSGTRAGRTSSRRCSASSNPVAGPYFNFTVPEPTGVVAILAPDAPPLLGLVSRVAPAIVGGNAVVAVASESRPLAAVELAEALATSDLPGGVVNILTGFKSELAPWLAGHMDVNAIDIGSAGSRRRRRAPSSRPRRGERQAGRPRRGRWPEPVGDRRLPGAEDRLASDRPIASRPRDRLATPEPGPVGGRRHLRARARQPTPDVCRGRRGSGRRGARHRPAVRRAA